MADTRVQVEVEDWIRDEWMPERFGRPFYRKRLPLESGGVFDFDAVSDDKTIAACISTSSKITAGGKSGVGKLHKLRADMLFLVMATGLSHRLMVLSEQDMYECCEKEKASGRTPHGVEFFLATIPDGLRQKLISSRKVAADEVTRVKR